MKRMLVLVSLVATSFGCCLSTPSFAAEPLTEQAETKTKAVDQAEKRKAAAAKRKAAANKAQSRQRAQFLPPDVDPNLPNVLLLGDSISIGYMLPAREALKGEANVWRPATNCGPTTNGVANLDKWLGDRKWDVIHFNFGLHDLKYMGKDGGNLADSESPDSHQQVPIEQYAANIKKMATRLKETGATVIWREMTPVREGAKGRVPGDSAKYNDAAAKVIAELGGIETDPMFAFATENSQHQQKANVHYTPEGSKVLGEHVAGVVRAALKGNAK